MIASAVIDTVAGQCVLHNCVLGASSAATDQDALTACLADEAKPIASYRRIPKSGLGCYAAEKVQRQGDAVVVSVVVDTLPARDCVVHDCSFRTGAHMSDMDAATACEAEASKPIPAYRRVPRFGSCGALETAATRGGSVLATAVADSSATGSCKLGDCEIADATLASADAIALCRGALKKGKEPDR